MRDSTVSQSSEDPDRRAFGGGAKEKYQASRGMVSVQEEPEGRAHPGRRVVEEREAVERTEPGTTATKI